MTDTSGVEHFIAIGGAVVTGTLALLAWASGDKEGRSITEGRDREAANSRVAEAAGGAVYAGMIDNEAYRAVVDGIARMTSRLDSIDLKMARLVELGESQDEREAREQQHKDLSEMLRGMIDDLREDIARGDERRGRRPAQA